ncbi:MAG TPA: hypothetical protein VKW06_03360 [Candidatus Angelobacter sp.]|nr:hypothetical protein [Candidatus Angelobacter sp.]
MYRNPELPSLVRRIALSFALGCSIFALGAFLQHALLTFNIRGPVAYADDLVVGVLSGTMVFFYEQRRHKAILERIRVIAAMNHHVRNALQAITFSPYADNAKQIDLIEGAARRIQWALDEILPGAQAYDVPADPRQIEFPRA